MLDERKLRSLLSRTPDGLPSAVPHPEAVSWTVRARRSRRRLVGVAASVLLVVAVVAPLALLGPLGAPRPAQPGTNPQWPAREDRRLHISFQAPPTWHVQPFQNVCMASFTGTMVSNIPHAYVDPVSRSGCFWPPSVRTLPANLAIVEFDELQGGPALVHPSSPLPDTTFPLHLDLSWPGIKTLPVEGGTAKYWYIRFTLDGVPRYTVNIWIGSQATPEDQAIAERVLRSIRPAGAPPTPTPNASAYSGPACSTIVPACPVPHVLPFVTLRGSQHDGALGPVAGSPKGIIDWRQALARAWAEDGQPGAAAVRVELGTSSDWQDGTIGTSSTLHWAKGPRLYYAVDWFGVELPFDGGPSPLPGASPQPPPSPQLGTWGTVIDAETGAFVVGGT